MAGSSYVCIHSTYHQTTMHIVNHYTIYLIVFIKGILWNRNHISTQTARSVTPQMVPCHNWSLGPSAANYVAVDGPPGPSIAAMDGPLCRKCSPVASRKNSGCS